MNGAVSIFDILNYSGSVFASYWWVILPAPFWYIFNIVWFDYVSHYGADCWNSKYKWTMLEVIPPREIERGPKPMEIFFTGLSGVISTHNHFSIWLDGAFRQDFFGLELVGEEGKVHYYIRLLKKHRNLVEAQIYAQYPEAQVMEVEDYYTKFPKVIPNKKWDLWGADFIFVKPDPYYPIKTYDQFEESITGEMIDPMAALVEVLGTLGPGQHIWLQYVIVPVQEGESIKGGKVLADKLKFRATESTGGRLIADVVDVLSNLWAGLFAPPEFKVATAKKDELPLEMRLSTVEKDILKAVEENLGKNFFKTKMRMIYLGKREGFDKSHVSAFVGAIKQFNDLNMNQIKPEDISKTYGQIFFVNRIANLRKRKIYDRYRRRNMDGANLMLSTKELATMFHFPDLSVKSHAITQTTSKLGAAPSNLPID
ncbi:MAG: hypothetical protein WCO05_01865 [Candidatus Moraniibacteriota bacterium]|jgi:hypothetical protein